MELVLGMVVGALAVVGVLALLAVWVWEAEWSEVQARARAEREFEEQ
jgi:hypothetical protein